MPEARSNSAPGQQPSVLAPETAAPAPRPTGLRRWFPWLASVLVVTANGLVTYRMDADTATGHASGMPYLLLTLLFVAIFAAHHHINRNG